MQKKKQQDQSRNSKIPAAATDGRLWKWGAGLAAAGALAGSALYNRSRTRKAERANPPLGKFLTIDGVRLHYLDQGKGDPIVLLHGNGTMVEDWIVSGLIDGLAKDRRVIAFDRPGFGHSDRPRSRIWTPAAQASLIDQALQELGVSAATVVGHSYGTLVALSLALDHPKAVSRLVLLGGYFYPSVRADVFFASQPAVPVIGDVMRHTVSPFIGAAMMPRINSKVFSPAPVPKRWTEEFPLEMTLRPSQIRAEAEEAAMMIPAAAALSGRYADLRLPVTIVAGRGDELVDIEGQSELLHSNVSQSKFVAVAGAGHMVHHTATDRVISAIRGA
jgi:pimeloyl-ACP methyl ester carboxylesterase